MLLAVLAALWGNATPAAEPGGGEPLSLIITYHAKPAARSALRTEIQRSTVPLLRKLLLSGV
jgi:hypothetical protein